jgi:hypothetical protein
MILDVLCVKLSKFPQDSWLEHIFNFLVPKSDNGYIPDKTLLTEE